MIQIQILWFARTEHIIRYYTKDNELMTLVATLIGVSVFTVSNMIVWIIYIYELKTYHAIGLVIINIREIPEKGEKMLKKDLIFDFLFAIIYVVVFFITVYCLLPEEPVKVKEVPEAQKRIYSRMNQRFRDLNGG